MPIAPPTAVASPYRPVVTPLAPDRYRMTFTADAETCELLAQAKDMLAHAVPSRDTAEVMKRALKALLRDLARKKFAATDKAPEGRRGAHRVRDSVRTESASRATVEHGACG